MKQTFVRGKAEGDSLRQLCINFQGKTYLNANEVVSARAGELIDFNLPLTDQDFEVFAAQAREDEFRIREKTRNHQKRSKMLEEEYGEGFRVAANMEGFDPMKGLGRASQGIIHPVTLDSTGLFSTQSQDKAEDATFTLALCQDLGEIAKFLTTLSEEARVEPHQSLMQNLTSEAKKIATQNKLLHKKMEDSTKILQEAKAKIKVAKLTKGEDQTRYQALAQTVECIESNESWSAVKKFFSLKSVFVSEEVVLSFFSLASKGINELEMTDVISWKRLSKCVARCSFLQEAFNYCLGKRGARGSVVDTSFDPLLVKVLTEKLSNSVILPKFRNFYDMKLAENDRWSFGLSLLKQVIKGKTDFERQLLSGALKIIRQSEENIGKLIDTDSKRLASLYSELLAFKEVKEEFTDKILNRLSIGIKQSWLSAIALSHFLQALDKIIPKKTLNMLYGFFVLPYLNFLSQKFPISEEQAACLEFLFSLANR